MRKPVRPFGRALFGSVVGSVIGLSSAFVLVLFVAEVSYLLGHLVFLYGPGGMAVGAIIGAIAGAALGWRAATEQQS